MILKSALRRRKSAPEVSFPPIAPKTDFYAVGDIHGRADLLERLLQNLPDDLPIVFVGDYIDRGEDNRRVLEILMGLDRAVCLRGNHEDMMIGFLDAPAEKGPRWIRNGGLQTLANFNVPLVTENSKADDLIAAAEALRSAMGKEMIGWLRDLPMVLETGNVAVVHAGAAPDVPMRAQSRNTVMWGHRDFNRTPRTDGLWVVHGHTITDAPYQEAGRIGIDTGAYATGRLTVARISRERGVEFSTA